jgi:hypothetical protein
MSSTKHTHAHQPTDCVDGITLSRDSIDDTSQGCPDNGTNLKESSCPDDLRVVVADSLSCSHNRCSDAIYTGVDVRTGYFSEKQNSAAELQQSEEGEKVSAIHVTVLSRSPSAPLLAPKDGENKTKAPKDGKNNLVVHSILRSQSSPSRPRSCEVESTPMSEEEKKALRTRRRWLGDDNSAWMTKFDMDDEFRHVAGNDSIETPLHSV